MSEEGAQELEFNLEGDAAFGATPHTDTPTEVEARKDGWRPEDEWEGDPDQWVDAKEFVYRGSLMRRIQQESKSAKTLRKELDQLRGTVKQLAEHNRKLASTEKEEMIDDLNDMRKEALQEQNFDKLIEIEGKIKEVENLEDEIPEVPESDQTQEHPAVAAWREQNDWYDSDPVLAGAADALATQLRQKNPDWEPEKLLEELTIQVAERFFDEEPESEETEAKPKSKAPRTTETGRQGRKTGTRSNLVSKLNTMQKQMGQTFVEEGAIESIEEYAKQLREIGEI